MFFSYIRNTSYSVLTLDVFFTYVLVQIVLALLQLVHYLRLTAMTTYICKVRCCSLLMLLYTYVGCVFHLCLSTNCTCVVTVGALLTFNDDDHLRL